MKVFVTGGTGYIGRAVVAELIGAGHEVSGLARSDASAAALREAGATPVSGSVDDLETLASAASAADGVIHLAYDHDFSRFAESAQAELDAVTAIGEALSGSGKPFALASGALGVAPPGIVGTESDGLDPGASASPRGRTAAALLAYSQRGVRGIVVRLAPSVHDEGRGAPGFVGRLARIARETGVAGYPGDGGSRWPAVHRLDAAHLFFLALGQAPAGSVLHAVAEQGVTQREIAETIGAGLGVPVRAIPDAQLESHFGWLAPIVALDSPALSDATRARLGWQPRRAGLLEDLRDGHYLD